MPEIIWLTSAKPATDPNQFLEQNCLLKDFTHRNCRLLVVNSTLEKNSVFNVAQHVELRLVDSPRPTIRDLLSQSNAEITVLSNADIRAFFKRSFSEVIDPNASLSVSRRYDVEFIEIAKNFAEADIIARNFGYHQSRFTIDFFVLSRAFRTHLMAQAWTRSHFLGQAGVDMAILREAYRFGIVRRLDQNIRLLHRNHEAFKVAFPVNIVIDEIENRSFSAKRGAAFSGEPASMIFASLPRIFVRIAVLRRLILRLDMATVKLRNRFQYWWSQKNRRRAQRLLMVGHDVRLATLGRVWYFAPARTTREAVTIDAIGLRKDLKRRYISLLKRVMKS